MYAKKNAGGETEAGIVFISFAIFPNVSNENITNVYHKRCLTREKKTLFFLEITGRRFVTLLYFFLRRKKKKLILIFFV